MVSSLASSIRSPLCNSSSSTAQSQNALRLGAIRAALVARRRVERLLGVVPAADRERAELRDLALEVDHLLRGLRLGRGGGPSQSRCSTRSWRSSGTAAGACGSNGEPSSPPQLQTSAKKQRMFDQPLIAVERSSPLASARGGAGRGAASSIASGMKARTCAGRTSRAAADLGEPLVQEAPEMLERVVLVTRRRVDVADPLLVDLQIQDVGRAGSAPGSASAPPAPAGVSRRLRIRRAAPRNGRSPEHPERAQRASSTSLPDPTTTGTARRSSSVICSSAAVPADHHDPKPVLQRLVPQRLVAHVTLSSAGVSRPAAACSGASGGSRFTHARV